ncbi:MAG: FAD-dependent oxidoreductase [Anaerolineales bacterium]|jgi:sarcosine oxidase subunit beta
MLLPKSAEIIIIGGGVMGASTAYHLAARGQKNILLLEKEQFFGQGATGRCAGGVRYQFATEINIKLSKESLPMLERFEDEIGNPVDYRKIGYLFLITEEKDIPVFKKHVQLQNRLCVPTVWLDGDEVRQRIPIMQLEDVLAGTVCERDGIADPNGVVMGYISAAQRLGVNTQTGQEVTNIRIRDGKATGIETQDGIVSAPIIVNAAGPWSGIICQKAGVSIPITPLRRQWLTTTPLTQLPDDFPFVIDFSKSLYFHPEGDGLLTGMSNPNETPGFDQTVDPNWEVIHLEAAITRMPILEMAGLTSRIAGLYENTPDAHPIFGETPIEGFFLVTGFSGHGFMHGPIAGKLLSEIILDGESKTVDVSMLGLNRFDENNLIPEYNVV